MGRSHSCRIRLSHESPQSSSGFSLYLDMPQVLHCDQGWNFEDTALPQTLEAFGIAKSHTTAYHLSGGGGGGQYGGAYEQIIATDVLLFC